jgi:putative ABC transport system permease protein
VSVLAGSALALVLSRFVETWLYGITATDPATYLIVGLVVVAVGLIAASLPAVRAARVDPVLALRRQ